MNRLELAEVIATNHSLTKAEAARILATITDTVTKTVKKGETVSIVGFGTFERVERAARIGYNPRAGEKIKIAAAKAVKFKPGKAFKEALNPKNAKKTADKAASKPAKAAAKPAKAATKRKSA